LKRKVKIKRSRLFAPVDFGEVIKSRRVFDVALDYKEYDFIRIDGGAVLFDAYAASERFSHRFGDCGVLAFPFALTCMTDGGERVAYCGLRFNENKAAEWRTDCSDAERVRLAFDPDAASVPVNSGVCCLAGERAYGEYYSHIKDAAHPLAGLIVLDGQTHTTLELYGNRYAVFSTGWGDGLYKCYKGFDADGRLTAVIVDFGMIEYPERDDGEVEIDSETDAAAYVFDPNKSEFENSIAEWTAAIENAPDHVERLKAYSRRGYAYHSVNDVDKALADYMSAVDECRYITDKVQLTRAWSVFDNAAEIYCKKSDYESAIKLMKTALKVGDDFYAGAYVRLTDLYLLTKRTDKAKETAALMLKARPDDPIANMKFAEACVAAMEYADAASAYHVLAEKFKLYENLFDEASCLIELGDLDGADAALERHPTGETSEQYWYYKAYIDCKRKKYRDAMVKAERSHDIDPEYMPALYLLIDITSLIQEYYAVAGYAEEYKKLRPDKEYGYSVCAEAHLILGNYTESARNYAHLYDAIKKDDKYAALAAITASKTGDKKRVSAMLKLLRRKKSPYYLGAVYAVYITKYRQRSMALSKVVYKLDTDDEFLLLLAVFLCGTNNVLPAANILDVIMKKGKPAYEAVALQIRIAVRLGDEKLFLSLLDYYCKNFLSPDLSEDGKEALADRFKRFGAIKKIDWDEIKALD